MVDFRSTTSNIKVLGCCIVFNVLINLCILEKASREMEKNTEISFYDEIKGRSVLSGIGNGDITGVKVMVELPSLPINSVSAMANNSTKGQEDNYKLGSIVGTVHQDTSNSSPSPYAYVWIIGAIREDRPSYKGFLWDVLISASLLRKAGSTADFWLYLRFSPNSTLTEMPAEDTRLLK